MGAGLERQAFRRPTHLHTLSPIPAPRTAPVSQRPLPPLAFAPCPRQSPLIMRQVAMSRGICEDNQGPFHRKEANADLSGLLKWRVGFPFWGYLEGTSLSHFPLPHSSPHIMPVPGAEETCGCPFSKTHPISFHSCTLFYDPETWPLCPDVALVAVKVGAMAGG